MEMKGSLPSCHARHLPLESPRKVTGERQQNNYLLKRELYPLCRIMPWGFGRIFPFIAFVRLFCRDVCISKRYLNSLRGREVTGWPFEFFVSALLLLFWLLKGVFVQRVLSLSESHLWGLRLRQLRPRGAGRGVGAAGKRADGGGVACSGFGAPAQRCVNPWSLSLEGASHVSILRLTSHQSHVS